MKFSFFPSVNHTEPQPGEVAEFMQLADLLRDSAEDGKDTASLWSPAALEDGRTDGHCKSVEALGLDFDHLEPPWDKLSGWTYIAHTTHSHTQDDPHWRVIVELEEPGDPKTWKTQYKVKMQQHELPCDSKCCNPARLFFVPPTNAEWRTNEGRPAKMPSASVALEQERLDLAANEDGLLSDGERFWDDVVRMMKTLPPSVSGDAGHDRLFEAACTLRSSFRLTPEAAMKALREHYNPRCKPPWSDAELAHKVQQAAGDKQHSPGELVPPEHHEALRALSGHAPPPPPDKPAGPVLWAPAAALVCQVTEVKYLCKELGIRDGRPSLWTANARCGKTTIAASVALAVASGRPLWGRLKVLQGDVLYVAGEDPEGVARVWKRLALDQKIPIPAALHFSNVLPLAGPNCNLDNLKTALAAHRLVIFDTLRSLSREAGVEENDPAFADGLYTLDQAAQGTGCCMVVLHHNNKSGHSNGTAALFGAAGNHLEFNRDEEENTPLVGYGAGTRDGLRIPKFELELKQHTCAAPKDDPDSNGMRFEYRPKEGGRTAPNVEKLAHKVYERLQKADRWVSRMELTHDLPGKSADVTMAFATLEERVGFKIEGKSRMYHWNPEMVPKS